MSEELKPCPFCGGEAEHIPAKGVKNPMTKEQAVGCQQCGSRSIVPIWNTRAPDPDLHEAVKVLEGYAELIPALFDYDDQRRLGATSILREDKGKRAQAIVDAHPNLTQQAGGD